jgi:hypothetical protein
MKRNVDEVLQTWLNNCKCNDQQQSLTFGHFMCCHATHIDFTAVTDNNIAKHKLQQSVQVLGLSRRQNSRKFSRENSIVRT